MSKTLIVFGATGQQGGSIINHVLEDPELSQQYTIRAITRDITSEKAVQLSKQSVEVVYGDVSNRSSLETALIGAHTVFNMTTNSFTPDGFEYEYNTAKLIADISVEKGAKYIIFSTLPSVKEISGGKYVNVFPFDAKAKAEEYIRSLPIKSAFYCPGSFMQNYAPGTLGGPQKQADGTWVISQHVSGKTRFPLIDAVGDSGKVVGAILADPEKYEGKTFSAAVRSYTLDEMADLMTKVSGTNVVYKQISIDEFKNKLSFLGDVATSAFSEVFSSFEEFEYFGPKSEELIAWAAEHSRGRLVTFQEYLEATKFQLS